MTTAAAACRCRAFQTHPAFHEPVCLVPGRRGVLRSTTTDGARRGDWIISYTVRQYRPHQKAEFLRDFPQEARAAAALLGDELAGLRFYFATIGQDYDKSTAVRIEFHGKESDDRLVWVDVKGDRAAKVLERG